MPNQIYALILIIISMLPNSVYKTDLTTKIQERLIGSPVKLNQQLASGKYNIPFKTNPLAQAQTNSSAAYFTDFESGEVLFSKNENQKLPMASLTKLMTAIISTEYLDQNKVVTVGSLNTLPLDSVMGLEPGDRIKVSELLHGLLIESGADAANVLAVEAAGSESKFVAMMNEKATQFGLAGTQFTNPVGHDDSGNYSTAKDLYTLSRLALSNKEISQIVAEKTYTATSEDGKTYFLSNTNLLLSDPNFKGVKTGTTVEAGQCLISLYDDGTRKILGVMLASPDRFSDTSSVIEWTKQVFKW